MHEHEYDDTKHNKHTYLIELVHDTLVINYFINRVF